MDSLLQKDIPTKALVVEKAGAPFILQDIILGEIKSRELLVEIKYAGVCHTDLIVQAGHMPMCSYPVVLGHEGAGIIRSVGKDLGGSGLEVGDRIILGYCSCLNCSACIDGRKGACDSIAMVNFGGTRGADDSPLRLANGDSACGSFFGQSSFRQLAIVDSRAVIKYSGSVEDLSFLAPLGCGYMTGAATVLNVLKPKTTSSIAIFGLGAVGLCALMAAKSENVKEIIAIDIIESRLQLATSLGATKVMNSTKYESVEEAIHEVLPQGVDYIIDTTGSTRIINSGMKGLAHGGTFAVVGTPPPHALVEIEAFDMLVHCKTLIGVTGGYCNPQTFIPRLIEMFKSGSFVIDKLSKTYPASKIDEAIADMKSGKVIKPVLAW